MFTTAQISQAHSKVISGADFPAYIKEIRALGVTLYETWVSDGHTVYYGANDYKTAIPPQYTLAIAGTVNAVHFKAELKLHQQGGSSYPDFISRCAQYGIEKWAVCMEAMTCTYYDTAGNEVLAEQVPQ